ncbi:AAC(3) family N-acetyltransferase [Halarcobacter anaerophilus]|uniref:Aminoglycoside N(3)-acetyltransferase n=1 Tax=Halarcobacter anaerophilus TaxID=877500 RepID=A0A4Q0Y3L6_9BACT|nr:AAC(3) family N-acetyltransferase [Halarcobacter anaerophilus]QDF29511.1 aminoglycoside N3'-acetyltransferase [Halarcobacter anaerophilus]RXJ64750.1 hypothetical protein CRV06_02000 [Halarcobacter anaerophilus]
MRILVKQIKQYLPNFLKKKIDDKVEKNKLRKHRERKKRVLISLKEVDNLLNKFTLNSDIIIHSSTSNIGKIEGGTKELTNLIISKIDLSSYTLLAPALSFLGSQKEYLENLDSFNLQEAKNAMGNISNMIMKKDNCKRSFHPSHSVIAIGKNVNYYISDHEKGKTPFSGSSPYSKITNNNGKILMFGVNLNSVTNFHVYEDMLEEYLPFDVYLKNIYKIDSENNGKNLVIEVKAHNPFLSAKRDCERARKYLLKNGYIESYKLGDSEISLLDAKGLTITLLQMLLKGDSIYGKVKLKKKQKEKVNELLERLK